MDINEQSKKLSNRLINDFFVKKSHITGSEILEFCDEKQINLLIIYMLMQEWKENIEDLKTPFFDYDNDEVKKALQSYMNIVSKHIKVSKVDFTPLVENAINYTFQLAKNPESFIVGNRLESKLDEMNKYVVLHKPYFEGDKNYEAQNLLPQLLEKFDLAESNPQKIEESKQSVERATIHEKLADGSQKQSILDKYSQPKEEPNKTPPLKKINSIKNATTINQRFIFISELFNNDGTQYDNIIARLDNCNDYAEAKNLLAESLSDKPETESTRQLFLLIKQKFDFSGE